MSKVLGKSVLIREMEESELELVRQVLVESYVQYKEHFERDAWETYFLQVKASVENENIDKLYIAQYEDEIVGTMQLFRSSDEAYDLPELDIQAPIIRFLAVHPHGRGLGVAKKLIDKAVTYTEDIEAEGVYLHTSDVMERAIYLYEKYGFIREESQDFKNGSKQIMCYKYLI